jgi:hypothetical protein
MGDLPRASVVGTSCRASTKPIKVGLGDLRERVIEAVAAGASRREAAERFEVSVAEPRKALGASPAPRRPTWPNTAARRIPETSARDGTNAFTTWTPSPAGPFIGNFTAAGKNCGSRFPAA